MQINQYPETLAELEKFLEWAKIANPPINVFPYLSLLLKEIQRQGSRIISLETELESLSNEYYGYDP